MVFPNECFPTMTTTHCPIRMFEHIKLSVLSAHVPIKEEAGQATALDQDHAAWRGHCLQEFGGPWQGSATDGGPSNRKVPLT